MEEEKKKKAKIKSCTSVVNNLQNLKEEQYQNPTIILDPLKNLMSINSFTNIHVNSNKTFVLLF